MHSQLEQSGSTSSAWSDELESVEVRTFTAIIHCGLKERTTGAVHTVDEARQVCRDFVDKIGLCVSFTPTEYLYTQGSEPGVIVGLINYPRFPTTPDELKSKALNLARVLMIAFKQYMLSVVYPDVTVMLVNPALKIDNDNRD